MEAQQELRSVRATVIAQACLAGEGTEAYRALVSEALGEDAAARMAALAQLE